MSERTCMRGFSLALWVIAFTAVAGSTQARLLILSSDVENLEVSTELGDTDLLDVPAGRNVRILLPSGTTMMITGPAHKPVQELAKGQSLHKALWRRIEAYFAWRHNIKSAATRGSQLGRNPPDVSSTLLTFSVVPIPYNAQEGFICVLKGTPLSFARLGLAPQDSARSPTMRFSASPGERHAIVKWEGQSDTAPWPSSVRVVDGGWYIAVPNFASPSRFKIKTVDKSTVDGADILKVLEENRCYEQMKAWVWRLGEPG